MTGYELIGWFEWFARAAVKSVGFLVLGWGMCGYRWRRDAVAKKKATWYIKDDAKHWRWLDKDEQK